jgi:hypothetical protein
MSETNDKYAAVKPPPVVKRRHPIPSTFGDPPLKPTASAPRVSAPKPPETQPADAGSVNQKPQMSIVTPPVSERVAPTVVAPRVALGANLDTLAKAIQSARVGENAKPSSVRVTQQIYTDVRLFAVEHNIRPVAKVLHYLMLSSLPADGDDLPAWLLNRAFDETIHRPVAIPIIMDAELKRRTLALETYHGITITDLAEAVVLRYLPSRPRLCVPRRRARRRGIVVQ